MVWRECACAVQQRAGDVFGPDGACVCLIETENEKQRRSTLYTTYY